MASEEAVHIGEPRQGFDRADLEHDWIQDDLILSNDEELLSRPRYRPLTHRTGRQTLKDIYRYH